MQRVNYYVGSIFFAYLADNNYNAGLGQFINKVHFDNMWQVPWYMDFHTESKFDTWTTSDLPPLLYETVNLVANFSVQFQVFL